jgi:hypothetical protein
METPRRGRQKDLTPGPQMAPGLPTGIELRPQVPLSGCKRCAPFGAHCFSLVNACAAESRLGLVVHLHSAKEVRAS